MKAPHCLPFCRTILRTVGALLLTGALCAVAGEGTAPLSAQGKALAAGYVQQVVLPPTDIASELAADGKGDKGQPRRFAVPRPVVLTTTNSGTWEQLPEGRLWRLRVISAGATDINFGLSQFWLPQGATLHVGAESDASFQGPYTAKDNQADGQLWTAMVPGEAAFIELFVPAQATEEPRLVISQVSTGYRDFFRKLKDLSGAKSEGTCNNDVICPVGDPWRDEIRSVGVYSYNGVFECTGTLIMDAQRDFRPYFITANHCGLTSGNAGTVVVYWNYESATCGTHGPGSLSQNQSGATFRAAKYDVDFALIELNAVPASGFNVYYAGWDRSGTAPAGCVGIHHPDCDVKAISFSTVPLTTVDSCIGTGGSSTHWYVQWSSGVTEPGSSGSGIWDSTTHLLVGTLSGGNSVCGGSDLTDCYGKFALSWASGSSSADRLKDWLDPQNTGVTSVAGANPIPKPILVAAGSALVNEGCVPTNGVADPGETVTLSFSLQNVGTAPTTNLVATLLATGGVLSPSGPQSYGVLATGGATVSRSFTFTATGTCGSIITPTLQLQDGSSNYGNYAFSARLGALSGSAVTTTYSSGGLSTAIADFSTSDVPIVVPDTGGVSDVNVRVRLNHTYDADLTLSLIHPDGTAIALANNRGGSGDNFGSGAASCSGTFTVFDSSAGTSIASGTAPFAGTYAPEGLLSSLNGKPTAGTWKLRVVDGYSGDTGTVYCVQLEITSQPYACCITRPSLGVIGYNKTNQTFQLSVNGGTGLPYAIQGSTNPANTGSWVNLITNTSPFTFTDSNAASFPRRFYRARYP